MLVLPGANLVDANEVADRLRVQYEEAPLVRDMPENARARVSIGVACYSGRPGEEVPLDLLIKQADQALYKAKQQGKNRVELFRSGE
jgi:diguanylate cyclase (GGDEF)-like protein